jgi:hypothetical protein
MTNEPDPLQQAVLNYIIRPLLQQIFSKTKFGCEIGRLGFVTKNHVIELCMNEAYLTSAKNTTAII